jgi:archaemetzincin
LDEKILPLFLYHGEIHSRKKRQSRSGPVQHMIHLFPMGKVTSFLIHDLKPSLEEIFKALVVLHEPVAISASSYDPARNQYSSTRILKGLTRLKGSLAQSDQVLAIVEEDLFASGSNFVFGEADPDDGVAVISLARLRQEFYGRSPDQELFDRRMLKEAVHELGHTFFLGHCPNAICVMHFSNRLEDTDHKRWHFCEKCEVLKDRARKEG